MAPIFPLLALLARVERHGYELKAWADAHLGAFWGIDFGQLYRTLQRAVDTGWIVAAERQKSAQGPERRTYRLTPAGRNALDAWFAEPAVDDDELIVKLGVAESGGVPLARIARTNHLAVAMRLEAARAAYLGAVASRNRGAIVVQAHLLRRCETVDATLALAGATVKPRARAPAAKRKAAAEGAPAAGHALCIAGSDDPLLAWLAGEASVATRVVGSYGGLWSLQRHRSDAASMHLLDPLTNEYNLPFLERLFPEDDLVLVNIAWRETGLIVARGNPKAISGVTALLNDDLRFINRQREAGTRQLLARRLRDSGIDPGTLRGWNHCASTHDGVAREIVLGNADVGPGLHAVAAAWGLDFVPLAIERYDLALPRSVLVSKRFIPLRAHLRSPSFRRQGARMRGYDLRDSGRIVGRTRAGGCSA